MFIHTLQTGEGRKCCTALWSMMPFWGALNQSLDTFATFAEKAVKGMAHGMFSLVKNTQDLS